MSIFKENKSFDERKKESERILAKYSDRLPIVVEKHPESNIPDIDKHKFLVPDDLTMGQFLHIIRKRIKLNPNIALFIFVDDHMPSTASQLVNIYQDYKDEDGFLYMVYSGENTFGHK